MNKSNRVPLATNEGSKANKALLKTKKIKVSIIFNLTTHRMLKSVAAVEGKKISDVVEKLVYEYLKDKGKVV